MTNPGRFFDNPMFLDYARMLRQLHALIRSGLDESPEGEALRERMDGPAAYLSGDEVDCLNSISADFYSLSDTPALPHPEPSDLRHRLEAVLVAREAGDFASALDHLRGNEMYLDPAVVAYMRGRIWSEACEPEIAMDFFRRAQQLDSRNGDYRLIWLDALSRIRSEEGAAVSS